MKRTQLDDVEKKKLDAVIEANRDEIEKMIRWEDRTEFIKPKVDFDITVNNVTNRCKRIHGIHIRQSPVKKQEPPFTKEQCEQIQKMISDAKWGIKKAAR